MLRQAMIRIPLQYFWAILLTKYTIVLGGAPLKALRNALRPAAYWILIAATTLTLGYLAPLYVTVSFALQGVLIGIYAEFEEHGFSVVQSAMISLTSTALLAVAGISFSFAYIGSAWYSSWASQIDEAILKHGPAGTDSVAGMTGQQILSIFPSIAISAMVLSLALALMFERPLSHWMGVVVRRKEKLTSFALPEVFIWPLIGAILFAFAQTDIQMVQVVGKNALNVFGTLYFIQGLAVLLKSFEIFKIGFFGRFMMIMIFAIQLPILLAVVGVVDYWADFRKLFQKKITQAKKRLQE